MSTPLPQEILQQIFSHLSGNQPSLHASSLTSRAWYAASIAHLYASPLINGRNYDRFVRAMCPSVNAHVRRNGLADLVRRLDMSGLVHNGSKSLTARVLGRVKSGLEEFVAPQASFAVNCLAALSKCSKLRHLDLSFVSESISMADLLRSTSLLPRLESLHLPRSSAQGAARDLRKCTWPAKLRELHIAGGIRDEPLVSLGNLPPSLTRLSLANCPHLTMASIDNVLKTKGPQLHHLEIVAPIPALASEDKPLGHFMKHVPNLQSLKISVDFLSVTYLYPRDVKVPHALRQIDFDCLDPMYCTNFGIDSLYYAIAATNNGKTFSRLRKVRVHRKLGWHTWEGVTEDGKGYLALVDELLKDFARENEANAKTEEADAGVILYGKESRW